MSDSGSDVDEAFVAASIGERVWLFFHRRRILSLIAATIALVMAIWLAGRLHSGREASKMRREYASLATPEEKAKFIVKHRMEKLAGVASLALADDYLANGNYAAAEAEYERACKILRATALLPRAMASRAVAMHRLGNFEEAEKLLNAVVYGKKYGKSFRGSAAYALAEMLRDRESAEKLEILAKDVGGLELSASFEELIRAAASRR
ncbi:MAG: hypothetical protein LBI61_04085 [Puniceicoccales bacterium]|nr:hypothetical protein [Puniceicoccales bacterium]